MSQVVRHCFWVILGTGLIFFLNLGVPQLWDEDEPKNAACAREMLERNDWVVPMFNYELRTAKPVLLYWFMMTAYGLFGVNEFSARFWSAVLGIGTCLLTYGIGRRLFQPAVGLWSALMLASGLMFGVASRAATPDAPLIFFSTLALALFVWTLPRQADAPDSATDMAGGAQLSPCHRLRQHLPTSWWAFVAIYAAMGLAVLAKGPVGVALPTLILMSYLWCRHWNTRPMTAGAAAVAGKSTGWWARTRTVLSELSPVVIWRVGWVLRPLTAVALVALIAIPWYVWVGYRTNGEWIAGFLGKHNVGRFVQPLEGHSGPIFYYVIAVLIGFFPWSIFLPLAMVRLAQRLRNPQARTAGDEFCACWALVYLVFFSLASTKLPSYVLPCYPALALITGRWVVEWLAEPVRTARWLPRWGFVNMAIVGVAFLVAIPIVTGRYIASPWYMGWAGLVPLTGGLLAWWQFEQRRPKAAARIFGATAYLFPLCLFGIVAVQINPHQTSAALMSKMFTETPEARVATFDYFEPSLAYYAGRPVTRLKTPEQAASFLTQSEDAYLIIRDKDRAKLEGALEGGLRIVDQRQRFLKSGEILTIQAAGGRIATRISSSSAN